MSLIDRSLSVEDLSSRISLIEMHIERLEGRALKTRMEYGLSDEQYWETPEYIRAQTWRQFRAKRQVELESKVSLSLET